MCEIKQSLENEAWYEVYFVNAASSEINKSFAN